MQLTNLRKCCKEGNINWSAHGLSRLQERGISVRDVILCIEHGEIIEDYPNDFPHPSCLIYGSTVDAQIIHTVAGYDGIYIYIITAYFPSLDKFLPDLKTRRQ